MAKQMIYTSCRRGREVEGSGFQVYSYTDGIEKDVREKLVKLGSYSLGTTGLKTVSDNYEGYPLAYRFWAGDTCKAIIRSEYLGLDWSGTRVGSNYLAHSIVFNQKEQTRDGIYPVSFVGSESFENCVDKGQFKKDQEPEALGEITPKENKELNFEEVRKFINMQEKGIQIVKTTISRLLEGKSMIISDTQENLKMWVAACTMILPRRVAWNISFSTYDPAGTESQFQTISGGPSIIGIWLADGEKYKTSPSDLAWKFDSDIDGLFEKYIETVFGLAEIRQNYLKYVDGLDEIDTIQMAIACYIVHHCSTDPDYCRKLFSMIDANRCCFDDCALFEIGRLLLTSSYSKSDSIEMVEKLLVFIQDGGKKESLRELKVGKVVELSKVKEIDELSKTEVDQIQKMLSKDCKENLPDIYRIVPLSLIVDKRADICEGEREFGLKYSDNQIKDLVRTSDSKGKLQEYMVQNGKVGYIMKSMPLDPEFKKDVAQRYFEDIQKHEDIKKKILSKPWDFLGNPQDSIDDKTQDSISETQNRVKSVIEAFYETDGILNLLKDEEDVFKFSGTYPQNKELITAYARIIEFHTVRPKDIEPLIQTLANRIYENDSNHSKYYFDILGTIFYEKYRQIELIHGKLLFIDARDKKSTEDRLTEFSESLSDRNQFVKEILEGATNKIRLDSKFRSSEATLWLNQLITIFGGPSEGFGNLLIGGIGGQSVQESETQKKRFQSKKNGNDENIKLQVKCFYITALMERKMGSENNGVHHNAEPDQSLLSPTDVEIMRCKVSATDLEKYLKTGKEQKKERNELLQAYRQLIEPERSGGGIRKLFHRFLTLGAILDLMRGPRRGP